MLNVPGKLRPGQAAPHGATTGYSPKSQKYKKKHLTGREPESGNLWQVAPAMLSLLQGALGGPTNPWPVIFATALFNYLASITFTGLLVVLPFLSRNLSLHT